MSFLYAGIPNHRKQASIVLILVPRTGSYKGCPKVDITEIGPVDGHG